MMFALPIVGRELRVASRRAGTYWLRFWVALLMLAVWLLLLAGNHGSREIGTILFNGMGVLALGFSLLAGVFLTADCLSEEKREGTLGLLFLTDLKAYDVVLGKLAANSLAAFFGLLSIFPIFGLSLLLGGVTGPEFARLSLVFLTTLFFSLSLGMVVSAVTREAKQAIAGALLLLVIFVGILPALWWLQRFTFKGAPLDFLLSPCPAYAYRMGFDTYYRSGGGAEAFWTSLGTILGLGIVGILIANFFLPHMWQEGGRVTGRKAKDQLAGEPKIRIFWQQQLDPMYWLAARRSSPQRHVWAALLLLAPIWLIATIIMLSGSAFFAKQVCSLIAVIGAYAMHLLVKCLIASEASRGMNHDRRSGAWELLLVTPLQVNSILAGQVKALQRHFFGPMLALVGVNLIMLIVMNIFFNQLHASGDQESITFDEIYIGGIICLFMDFYGLVWVGMWRGLNAKHHHRAIIATLGQVMGTPLLAVFFLIFAEPVFAGSDGPMMIVIVWFIGCIGLSGFSGSIARNHLHEEFRDVVAGTNQPRFVGVQLKGLEI